MNFKDLIIKSNLSPSINPQTQQSVTIQYAIHISETENIRQMEEHYNEVDTRREHRKQLQFFSYGVIIIIVTTCAFIVGYFMAG